MTITLDIVSIFISDRVYHKLEQWFLIDVRVVRMVLVHFGKNFPCCSLAHHTLYHHYHHHSSFENSYILISNILEDRELYHFLSSLAFYWHLCLLR